MELRKLSSPDDLLTRHDVTQWLELYGYGEDPDKSVYVCVYGDYRIPRMFPARGFPASAAEVQVVRDACQTQEDAKVRSLHT